MEYAYNNNNNNNHKSCFFSILWLDSQHEGGAMTKISTNKIFTILT